MKTILKFIIFCFVSLLLMHIFLGCSAKKELMIKTEYQEVKVPIKCPLKVPKKPRFNNDLSSAKRLSAYYLEVEYIAKSCTSGE